MQNMYGKLFFVAVLYVTLLCVQCEKYCISSVKTTEGYPIQIDETDPPADKGCHSAIDSISYKVTKCITGDLRAEITVLLNDDTTRSINPITSSNGHEDVWQKMGSDGYPESGSDGDCNIKKDEYKIYGISVNQFDIMEDAKEIGITVRDNEDNVVGVATIAVCLCS